MGIEDEESRLGHDPLEWLQEDDEEVGQAEAAVGQAQQETSAKPEDAEPAATPEATEVAMETEPEPAAMTAADDTGEGVGEPVAKAPPAAVEEKSSLSFDNHKATILLPERLTIHVVEPLQSEWKTLFYDVPQQLVIDATEVHDVDAAGIQLLYILVQQQAFKGCDVEITNVHHALQRFFNLAGLADFFAKYTHAA